MPKPTGSLARPWPCVVITSFGSTRKASVLLPRSIVPVPVIFTSGPTRLRSAVVATPFSIWNEAESCVRSVLCSRLSCQPDSVPDVQRADHLRDVEAADRAVLEIGGRGARHVRHDRLLALAKGTHIDPGLQPAVEAVEVGRTLQERQRAHIREVAVERVNRRIARDVDVDAGAALAAIGAEIGDGAFQNAARKRRFKCCGREMRAAEIEFGGRQPHLRIDIVEAGKRNRIVAPGGRGGLRRGSLRGDLRRGWRGSGRNIQPPEVEVEFDLWLAGDIDRSPAIEGAVADGAGKPVDHDDRAVEPDLGLARQRCLQQAGRLKRKFDGNGLPRHRRVGQRCLDVEGEWVLAGLRVAIEAEVTVRVDDGACADGFKVVFDVVMRVEEGHRAVGDGDAADFRKTRIVVRGSGWLGGCWFALTSASLCRSRRSGTRSSGWLITSSVISGWPDHTLASLTSA